MLTREGKRRLTTQTRLTSKGTSPETQKAKYSTGHLIHPPYRFNPTPPGTRSRGIKQMVSPQQSQKSLLRATHLIHNVVKQFKNGHGRANVHPVTCRVRKEQRVDEKLCAQNTPRSMPPPLSPPPAQCPFSRNHENISDHQDPTLKISGWLAWSLKQGPPTSWSVGRGNGWPGHAFPSFAHVREWGRLAPGGRVQLFAHVHGPSACRVRKWCC